MARWLGVLMVCGVAGALGCSGEGAEQAAPASQSPPQESGPDATPEADLAARIDGLLRKSDAATVERQVPCPPLPGLVSQRAEPTQWEPPPPPAASSLRILPAPAPEWGSLAETLPSPPGALAVGNDGTLYFSDAEALWSLPVEGTKQRLLDTRVWHLQFDGSGARLVAQGGGETYVQEAAGKLLPIDAPPAGRAFWESRGGEADGLLFVSEKVDFDASKQRRVALTVTRMDPRTGEREEATFPRLDYLAALGTLPATEGVWGHLLVGFRVDPMPAPLLQVDRGGIKLLTSTREAADLQPSSDVDGNLYWIRTWRRGGSSARGFLRRAGGSEEVPFTGRPTVAVACSATGPWVAWAVVEGSTVQLRRARREELRPHPAATAEAELRQRARSFVEALRSDLRGMPLGTALEDGDFGPQITRPPQPEELPALANAFRKQVRAAFGVEAASLADIDEILNVAGDGMQEEPALLLPLGALFLEQGPQEVLWLGDKGMERLGMDETTAWRTDHLTFTAFNPFYVARERLTAGASLARAAAQLTGSTVAPHYVAAQFSDEAVGQLQRAELKRAGLPGESIAVADLAKYLGTPQGRDNAALHFFAFVQGKAKGNRALALRAALGLADLRPAQAEAFSMLGEVLTDTNEADLARRCFERAVLLKPSDVDIRYRLADAYLSLDRLDEAEAAYRTVSALDAEERYKADVQGRLDLLKELRAEGSNP